MNVKFWHHFHYSIFKMLAYIRQSCLSRLVNGGNCRSHSHCSFVQNRRHFAGELAQPFHQQESSCFLTLAAGWLSFRRNGGGSGEGGPKGELLPHSGRRLAAVPS
jgi:hypothetical protein